MEYLVIRFGDRRPVLISGVPCGNTNELIQVEAGTHRISLGDAADFSPAVQKVVVRKTTVLTPMTVEFQMRGPVSLCEDLDPRPASKKKPRTSNKKRKTKKADVKEPKPKSKPKSKPKPQSGPAKKKSAKKKTARPNASAKGKLSHAS
jgi:outer membrane biosynthesis protein TonB